MESSTGWLIICPEQSMLIRRNLCQHIALRNHVFSRVILIVSQETTSQVNSSRRVVVQLNPRVTLTVVVNKVIFINDQHFIDFNGSC